MKRSTAIGHIIRIAEDSAVLAERSPAFDLASVVSVWAFGKVLDADAEWSDADQFASCAIAVDLPEPDVPWLAPSRELTALDGLARWNSRPVVRLWRSSAAPVWNHHIVRPLLLWHRDGGLRGDAVSALSERIGLEELRDPGRSAEELAVRLRREAEVSLTALRRSVETYDDKRWSRERTLPYADALFECAYGYCDLLSAMDTTTG